jgi:hypothetical protein
MWLFWGVGEFKFGEVVEVEGSSMSWRKAADEVCQRREKIVDDGCEIK